MLDVISHLESVGTIDYDTANGKIIYGSVESDSLLGNSGQDIIVSGEGIDNLNGGSGDDKLYGGKGNDTLTGGTGNDEFIINTGDGIDTITDFADGDKIIYNGTILSGKATNLENGNYKLQGFALQKQGNNLYITSDGTSSGVTINGFFSGGYDEKTDYPFAGIIIPATKHDPDSSTTYVYSPIVLDLNGDGLNYIYYSGTGQNVHFDIDSDGYAEGMQWLSSNDGFLVRDLNGNGVVDNQKEMFGDDSGTTAYYKLAQLDTNHDNKVDASDTGFSNLRIWQDLNSNGKTDSGEVKTLTAAGISNLSLQLTNDTTLNGQSIAGTSSFTRTNGTVGNAADVLFSTNQFDSIYVGMDTSVAPALDLTTLFLPLSHGYGTLPALQYAMTQNSTLKTMVSDLYNLNAGTQMHEVYDRVNAIMLEWAGATNIAPTGSDTGHNAAKTAFVNLFSDSPVNPSLNIDLSYARIFNMMASKLLIQGPLHSVFSSAYYDYETDDLVLNKTNEQVLIQAKNFVPVNMDDKIIYWVEIARILHASTNPLDLDLDAKIKSAAGFDYGAIPNIIGTSSNDILNDSIGNDVIWGGAGDDIIYASDGNDTLNGGVGNDIIIGGKGSDTINGGDGIDTVSYASSASAVNIFLWDTQQYNGDAQGDKLTSIENIIGTSFNDIITGNSDPNNLDAGPGDDILNGGLGADIINGGAGMDTISYNLSTAAVNVNLSLPSTTGQSGGYADGDMLSNIENVTGSAYADTLTAITTGSVINGGAGADIINGGAGIDTVSYVGSAGVNINLNLPATTAQSGGDAQGDKLSSIENIIGSSNSDILIGNSDNNLIDGVFGNDTLTGGAGVDIFVIRKDTGFNDIITDFSTSTAGEYISLVNFTSPVDFAHLSITQSGSNAVINLGSGQTLTLQNVTASSLTASSFGAGSVIAGTSGNDTLNGTTAIDIIYGFDGDDFITGSGGADTIYGGNGIDTVSYASSNAGVTVNPLTNGNTGGDAAGDTLNRIENITGSAYADNLTAAPTGSILDGGAGNDTLTGGIGNDTLIGGAGNDYMDGGNGSDTVSYVNSSVVVQVNLNNVGQDWGAYGDSLYNIENLIGSTFGDIITAKSSGSVIHGGDGGDTINGGVGNDTLYGDNGDDTFYAGDGDDIIYGGAGNDAIYSNGGNNILIGGAGADGMNGFGGTATADYSASASAVNINLTSNSNSGGDAQGDSLYGIPNIIGTNFDDTIIGDGFSNILSGGAGNDLLAGMGYGGNTLDGGDGIDTVSYSSASSVYVDLNVTTSQGWGASGDIIRNIENLIGSSNDDNLSAKTSGSSISGGDGYDTINGAAGNDILHGDGGNDTLYGSGGDDIIYGDAGDDSIYGGSGTNILIGGAGADGMNGFTGTATASYATSSAAISLNLTSNANTGGDAQGDTLYGIANIIGSGFNDIIVGNYMDNTIIGGAGVDTLSGGTGADIFKYSAATESGAAAGVRDIITDFTEGTDKIDLGDFAGAFTFKGTSAFTGAAHEVNYAQVSGNTIIGVDADGNGALDFQIELAGLHTLTANDFLL